MAILTTINKEDILRAIIAVRKMTPGKDTPVLLKAQENLLVMSAVQDDIYIEATWTPASMFQEPFEIQVKAVTLQGMLNLVPEQFEIASDIGEGKLFLVYGGSKTQIKEADGYISPLVHHGEPATVSADADKFSEATTIIRKNANPRKSKAGRECYKCINLSFSRNSIFMQSVNGFSGGRMSLDADTDLPETAVETNIFADSIDKAASLFQDIVTLKCYPGGTASMEGILTDKKDNKPVTVKIGFLSVAERFPNFLGILTAAEKEARYSLRFIGTDLQSCIRHSKCLIHNNESRDSMLTKFSIIETEQQQKVIFKTQNTEGDCQHYTLWLQEPLTEIPPKLPEMNMELLRTMLLSFSPAYLTMRFKNDTNTILFQTSDYPSLAIAVMPMVVQ